ncbi:ABC transporter ATP-binding protein/permease [Aureisphaera sp. CAU 1614]|uniref:ABC transporter ATP-binding protein/permease n=1 Tax=Halomarinibacterium sedimenti TaxID=2857106 RepID=A0A9X1FPS1_9FLAO|nr:ABC transporter ATP-binding protein [Halomarinibacterium sedimenti]MBW2937602.1 ABC transporter ATP-binding protein/permease [Halomarinibacterium sedimenti]
MKELRFLNKYFYKYRGRLLIGLVITAIATIFRIVVPSKIGDSVNSIQSYFKNEITYEVLKSQLLEDILIIIGAALLSGLFTFMMRQTIIVVSRYVEFDLKNEVFKQYERLSLNFYKQNRTGDLMNRISEDVSKVRMYAGPALMYSTTTVTLFIVALSYMIYTAPLLTLYAVAPLPILSIGIYKLSIAIHKRSSIVQQYLSKLTTFTQESFSGISVIKAYGIEPRTNAQFVELSNISKDKNIDLTKVQALFFPVMALLIGISNILVIYVGGNQFINGEIEFGTIVEFLIYVNMLTWPVAIVGWVSSMVQQAEASQKRINEFLKEEPQIKNYNDTPSEIIGKIAFENVTFSYPDTQITALKNVSFTIQPGETIGIIGNTGSGKSTILELIGRLFDVQQGSIKVDDIILKDLNLKDLRSAIGYVPQDAFLFSDSIKNNIKFGKADATDEEVIAAAKYAAVHRNIDEFQNKYETVLGERGITLSGGQKQRVSIARAIIKEPKILLFDDCLSAVDTETEEEILQNFQKVSEDKTTLIVSHRLSSVKNADTILVLENGNIIQQGTHTELLNTEGYYKELYHKQLLEKEM